MGNGSSAPGAGDLDWLRSHPEHDRFVGLCNVRFARPIVSLLFTGLRQFGNTCYANSSLQALYFCIPFRMAVASWYKQQQFERVDFHVSKQPNGKEKGGGFWSSLFGDDEHSNTAAHMLEALAELWHDVGQTKRQLDRLEPRRFINTLRAQNLLFRSHAQQDAHEFLFFLLNDVAETLDRLAKEHAQRLGGPLPPKADSFVEAIFQGKLVTSTQCLTCEVRCVSFHLWLPC